MWKNSLDPAFAMLGEQTPGQPTVLFIHGAGGNIETLGPIWHSLQANVNLAAINLPGRKDPRNSLDTISALAAYAMGFIAGSASQKPWLIGHSLGAAIALEVASKWQDMLHGLVLCNTAPTLPLSEAFMLSLNSNFSPTMNRFICSAYGPQAPPALIEECLKLVQDLPRETMLNDFKACRTYNSLPYLKHIKLPVLVLTGLNDIITKPSEGQKLADRLDNARLVGIGGAGHMAPYEMPERMTEEILVFIHSHENS